ncbi:HET-domain-containing protein [Acephala macrosclerotiorum]|nr:HET-domain-containing protein [Acephala macrosclerotiorum]
MKSTFKHSPLPHGQYFRVLKLLPGTFEDPIQCELPTYELDNAPSYEPISYAWGDPTMSHEITVDNCTLFITKTLFQALRRFRQQAERRFLWTDGICINQSDDTEKGHQVGFMSNIYEHGSRTLIWLGENDEHEDCAMTEPGCAESSFAMIKEFNRCRRHRCLKHLFNRPWFSRCWVLMEVALIIQ